MCNLLKYQKEVFSHTDVLRLDKPCSARSALICVQYLYYQEVTAWPHRPSFGAGAD